MSLSADFDVLVGGAPIHEPSLHALLAETSGQRARLIAADGGANHLARLPETIASPDLILGDMDSLEDRADWEKRTEVRKVHDQNSTDFDKAVAASGAPVLLCAGFLGGRFDQSLTCLHLLAGHPDRRILILGEVDVMTALPPGGFTLELPLRTRVSLWPWRRTRFTGSEGLRYPLGGLTLETGLQTGTSNETVSPSFSVSADDHGCVLILPVQHWPDLLLQARKAAA